MGSTPTWSTKYASPVAIVRVTTVLCESRPYLMGQSWFRLGQEYERGQLGNAEALGLGLFPVEEAKQK